MLYQTCLYCWMFARSEHGSVWHRLGYVKIDSLPFSFARDRYVDKLSEKAASAVPADCAVPAAKRGAGAVRIHAAWHQTSVRTGRLSCARPNLQQVCRREGLHCATFNLRRRRGKLTYQLVRFSLHCVPSIYV